jgi:hypothetical protein
MTANPPRNPPQTPPATTIRRLQQPTADHRSSSKPQQQTHKSILQPNPAITHRSSSNPPQTHQPQTPPATATTATLRHRNHCDPLRPPRASNTQNTKKKKKNPKHTNKPHREPRRHNHRDGRWVGHGSGDRHLQIWCERDIGSGVRGEAGSRWGGCARRGWLGWLGVGGLCEEGVARGKGLCEEGVVGVARGGGVVRGGGGSWWGVVRGGGGWALGREQRQRAWQRKRREREQAEAPRVFLEGKWFTENFSVNRFPFFC